MQSHHSKMCNRLLFKLLRINAII